MLFAQGVESASEVVQGFISSAERHPEKIAIADSSDSLTFSQLLYRVEMLAGLLKQRRENVEKSKILPILVDRSIESLVGVLSCIYAGIGFSPIDGELPEERVEQLLARLNCEEIVLAVPKFAGAKFLGHQHVVSTSEVGESLSNPSSVNLDDTALVIFTSGSTGAPKGVVFDWRCFAPKIFQARDYSELDIPTIRLGVTQPIYFSSGLGRQLTVSMGISVFLLDPTRLTPTALLKRVSDLEITNLSTPPSIIRNLGLIPSNSEIFLPSVRMIETGSEGIRFEDLAGVKRFFRDEVKVGHGLGATEGSCKIRNIFTLGSAPRSGQVPLGIETEPGQTWLLPPQDLVTEAQEILSGARLARGYLDDPHLTQERFIIDENGKRWWRSGDLVTRDENGVFWHKGRVDDLVKIRGKLASPSEATQVISSISGVKSVIVLPHDIGGATRLVAHIVPDAAITLHARDIRRALALALPAHLNPALLMRHEMLPTTSRQKIDRVALRSIPLVTWRDVPIIHPLTAAEFSVLSEAQIVLDLGELSVTDDLWEFGLDSLTAIELITRLEGAATLRLDIDDLLRNRTVEQIAKRIENTYIPHFENLILNEGGSRPFLFAIPGIGGHASHYVHLAKALGNDQPVLVFPDISYNARDLSIVAESERIAKSILEIQPLGTVIVAGYSGGGVLALEVMRRILAEGKSAHLILIDSGARHFGQQGEMLLGNMQSNNVTPNAISMARRKFVGLYSLSKSFGWRRGGVEIWYAIKHKYLGLRYLSIVFALSGGKYPRGIARYNYLAMRKARLRKNYRALPLDCDATYFGVKGNLAGREWQRMISRMTQSEVNGDHRTMLQPPYVLGLSKAVREVLDRVWEAERSNISGKL
jgi:acyl-coenzyme A synthetase/AMP-(fatty) acid ligase/thioesterase domain-containing protein/acyl carrier protein